jgi:hypothetical protein
MSQYLNWTAAGFNQPRLWRGANNRFAIIIQASRHSALRWIERRRAVMLGPKALADISNRAAGVTEHRRSHRSQADAKICSSK